MKSFLLHVVVILMFLASIFLVSYPFISNYLMGLNQNSKIESYEQEVQAIDEIDAGAARKDAEEYNKSLFGKAVLTDPFDPTIERAKDLEYENLLNPGNNSIMASVRIPAIDVNLPIYHGTSEEVLQVGIGHLQGSSLPVGGKGTHVILAGHAGLSTAKLFTDLSLIEEGDVFYIHCLNEILAYQVDQIKIVEPEDTRDLKIDPKQDYVTLVTCTPYGINSHRLLVRGVRIPYEETEEIAGSISKTSESVWMKEYKMALFIGSILFIIMLAIFVIVRKKATKKECKQS